jgi:arsenate reductase
MMNEKISKVIGSFTWEQISDERKNVLQGLVAYIQSKKDLGETIRLNFICTHNSRRSHLSQIWAQTMAYQYGIKNVYCYSGGTEATAMFPKVVETLIHQGFHIEKLSETDNPVYAVKFAQNEHPIICFSKAYHHEFNPKNNFAAVVTCNNADEACPIVFGAEARIPVKYNDPKAFDNTPQQTDKYAERSLEIAQEMAWVFSQIK